MQAKPIQSDGEVQRMQSELKDAQEAVRLLQGCQLEAAKLRQELSESQLQTQNLLQSRSGAESTLRCELSRDVAELQAIASDAVSDAYFLLGHRELLPQPGRLR